MVLKAILAFQAIRADFYGRMSVYSETRLLPPRDKKCYSSKVCGRNPKIFGMVIKHKNTNFFCNDKNCWLLLKILSFGPEK